jgi:putative membrane protein
VNDKSRQPEIIKELSALALDRTKYSSERSVLSWMRTSVSMYTFGFTITKFMDYLGDEAAGGAYAAGLSRFGLVLVLIGIVALVLAIIGHLNRLSIMKRLGLKEASRLHLPVAGAAILLAIGIAALFDLIASQVT